MKTSAFVTLAFAAFAPPVISRLLDYSPAVWALCGGILYLWLALVPLVWFAARVRARLERRRDEEFDRNRRD